MANKFNAVKTVVDGITFASKLEAKRYTELKLLEKAGKITCLELQPRFPLHVNGKLVCTYVADYRYWDKEKQMSIIEDCKGQILPVYSLKKKLMKAVLGFDIVEIGKDKRKKLHGNAGRKRVLP